MRPATAFVTFLALLALLMPLTSVYGQEAVEEGSEDGWDLASDLNLTLTQNAYSDNWAGSETGAISWALNANLLAEKQLTPGMNSRTALKLSFGQTHSQDLETRKWARPTKSTDLIDLESVLRFTYGWPVDPYVSGRIETQFLDESDPEKKRALNPVTFTESAGVSRVLIETEDTDWMTRLGGAIRQRMDRDALPEGASERETVTENDAGLEFVSEFRTPLADGAITLTSDLTVFKALYYSESDKLEGQPGEDDWKSPDVNWENTFAANVTEHIVVNLYVQLLYDKEVDQDPRFKETLSLGLTFRLL